MPRSEAELARRAEFYLCLARAFLPPAGENLYRGMAEQLGDDLDDLGERLDYSIAAPLAEFRSGMRKIPDGLTLLQLYSKLFLTPPTPASLNAGFYLDGAVMGPSVAEIEALYRRHGLGRSPDFPDTADHLTALLEFLSFMLANAGEAATPTERFDEIVILMRRYLGSWLPELRARIEGAMRDDTPNPYAALAYLLQVAVEHDVGLFARDDVTVAAWDGTALAPRPASAAPQQFCKNCGAILAASDDMDRIAQSLEQHGLNTAHMDICPCCRTHDMGFGETPALSPPRRGH